MSTRAFELSTKTFHLLLQAEKVRELNRGTPSAVAGHLLTAALYIWMVLEHVAQSSLLWWALVIGVVLFARMAIFFASKNFPNKLAAAHWLSLIRLGVLAAGLSWGAQAIFLLPANLLHQIMLAAVIIGINGAALAGLASDRWSLLMFSTGSSISLMAQFFISTSQVGTTIGLLMFLFWVYVIAAAYRGEHAFRNILTLREHVAAQNSALNQAQEISHIGSFNWNLTTGKLLWSEEHFRLWGVMPKSVVPDYALFMARIHPDDAAKVEATIKHALQAGNSYECEHRVVWPNGCVRHIHGSGKVIFDPDGQATNLIATSQDVTEQKSAEAKLELAANVFMHSHEGILITDVNGIIIDVNESFSNITGYARQEVLGNNPRMFKSGRHDSAFYIAMWDALLNERSWRGEIWNKRKDGKIFAVILTISAIQNAAGVVMNYVALLTDITSIKEYHDQLEHQARYDKLTGLPNRILLSDRLQHALVQSQRTPQLMAVVFLDLDGFKAVNDNHGHGIGDELLVIVTQRMKAALREGDTLARVGGDEFVAILINLEDTLACNIVLDRLLRAVSTPVLVGDTTLHVSASIGVTLHPQDEGDSDSLISFADQAMYQAKRMGKNRYCYFGDLLQNSTQTTLPPS